MWKVPGATGVDQFPALLAGGEMVLPAQAAEALRQMVGGSGSPGFGVTAPGAASGGGNHSIVVGGVGAGGGGNYNPYAQNHEAGQWAVTPWGTTVWAHPEMGIWEDGAWQGRGRAPAEDAFLDSLKGDGSLGPPPSVYGPGTERGGGGLPTPSRPSLGGSGGTNGAGGNVPKVTPAGGAKADEELLAVLGEIRTIMDNANRQRANVLDVLKQPQAIDFMRSGDPRALANLLAPFLADSLAQIYRRQWSPA